MSNCHYGTRVCSIHTMTTMYKLIKQIQQKFPFNKETDCIEKYNETIQDYLYEEIITKLNK